MDYYTKINHWFRTIYRERILTRFITRTDRFVYWYSSYWTNWSRDKIRYIFISGNDDGIHINDNNYWYSTGNFKVGSSTNLQNSSGNITIVPDTFTVNTSDGSFRVSSSEQVIDLVQLH